MLDKDFASQWHEWGESKTDIMAWAWEGHELAATVAYGDLKPPIPVEPPAAGLADRAACDAERETGRRRCTFRSATNTQPKPCP